MANKKIKTRPAGKNDKVEVTYTYFAANRERTEARTGKGDEFVNEELLKQLGFKENEHGVMSITATNNEVIKNKEGQVIRRTRAGRTLTEDKQSIGTER